MREIALYLALLLVSAPLVAQETRVAEEGQKSPPASIRDMGWLVGKWEGEGIGGAPAVENWLPATGSIMVGTFIQQSSDGGINFTEHMYLMEENGSLVLRIKHFNPDLTGWEDKEEMHSARLIAIEPCAAYFDGLTLRCDGDRGMVSAVRVSAADNEVREYVFTYRRAKPRARPGNCPDAYSTVEMRACLAGILESANERMQLYFDKALELNKDRDELLLTMRATQEGFSAYMGGECGAVYDSYGYGSLRGPAYLDCAIRLTNERTQTIWRNWLNSGDGSQSMLPEPEPIG